MKKNALLFCFITLSFICNAQIQTKILGAEIGVTTKGEIIEILKKENISFKEDGSGVTVSNVPFSQITWANGGFMLDNDKVIAVMLYDNEKGQKPEASLIGSALKAKYKDYLIQDLGAASIYRDDKTALVFLNKDKTVCIAYVANEYIMTMMSKFMNEL